MFVSGGMNNYDLDFQDGATPLFKAAHKGHTDCVSDLVSQGASLGLLEVCAPPVLDGSLCITKNLWISLIDDWERIN